MTTTTKFQSYVLTVTTLLVFTAWIKLDDFINLNPYLKILITSLISLSVYRIVASFFLLIFQKIKIVRKFFLGPKYMEGTWVGFYIGIGGKPRYIVEHYEQDFETLIIRGSAYDENTNLHTSWISFPANIDVQKGELTYMYELKGIKEKSNGTGIVFFSFIRKNQNSAPKKIKGFSADLHNNGFRTKSYECKLSDSNDVEDSEAIIKATDFYNQNKNNL